MIIGIGNDIVEIARIQKVISRPAGERFIARVLTPAEAALASKRSKKLAEFVAGRFAIKESVVKALGCGFGQQVGLQDIEVLPNQAGKPECQLSPEAWNRLGLAGERTRIHVSITHSETLAAGFAVVESDEGKKIWK